MLSSDLLLAVCLGYVAFLFAVAFIVDRQSRAGRARWLQSPVVYTLSISVYCTAWTFYGAVGSAARNGLEFVTIYLGPTLVFVGWWWFLRKLVRIGREQRITSIADLISSRYGKSPTLAVMVTFIAVIGTTPYIALQLQSVTRAFQVIVGSGDSTTTAFWVAAGMALFTILFGTRNVDVNERHLGVVAAIAIEAVVKLVALIAVGIFVVFAIGGGIGPAFEDTPPELVSGDIFGPRWLTLMFLSAAAIICLPRQFQVTVVENVDERHLITASWLFPLYLLGISLFTLPIAVVGLKVMPAGANPDLFVLSLPLAFDRHDIALLAFLGGFSSATSMVIVASIALSTMVSNHVVVPLALRFSMEGRESSGDVRDLLLRARRVSIAVILALGFLYFQLTGGSDALAAIGLIAFAGVAQFLPSLLGGIFWRGATRAGALAGLSAGFVMWVYTLFLPSFGGDFLLSEATLAHGPSGIELLRPQALLGLAGLDPLVHAIVWSIGLNTLVFLCVSAFSHPAPLERLQGALFVDVFHTMPGEGHRFVQRSAAPEDLFVLAQRILGAEPAQLLFDEIARSQGLRHGLPHPTDAFIDRLERELAGSVGAASANAMINRIAGAQSISLTELMKIADETQRLIETSERLGQKTRELEQTAAELRKANEQLRTLDAQKDDFLSHVSHELRTPMTSVRSFSEILIEDPDLDPEQRRNFLGIIHDESLRLTRLLDEILDISRLEAGEGEIEMHDVVLADAINATLDTVLPLAKDAGVRLVRPELAEGLVVSANPDRLRQVFLNLATNALKYNTAENPELVIEIADLGSYLAVDFIDNGGGVTREEASNIFSKFTRGLRAGEARGAGLGLPISRAIMRRFGGDLRVIFRPDGSTFFRVEIQPVRLAAE